jgi:hypothetical protein
MRDWLLGSVRRRDCPRKGGQRSARLRCEPVCRSRLGRHSSNESACAPVIRSGTHCHGHRVATGGAGRDEVNDDWYAAHDAKTIHAVRRGRDERNLWRATPTTHQNRGAPRIPTATPRAGSRGGRAGAAAGAPPPINRATPPPQRTGSQTTRHLPPPSQPDPLVGRSVTTRTGEIAAPAVAARSSVASGHRCHRPDDAHGAMKKRRPGSTRLGPDTRPPVGHTAAPTRGRSPSSHAMTGEGDRPHGIATGTNGRGRQDSRRNQWRAIRRPERRAAGCG